VTKNLRPLQIQSPGLSLTAVGPSQSSRTSAVLKLERGQTKHSQHQGFLTLMVDFGDQLRFHEQTTKSNLRADVSFHTDDDLVMDCLKQGAGEQSSSQWRFGVEVS